MQNKKIVLFSIIGFVAVFILATIMFKDKMSQEQTQVAKVENQFLKRNGAFVLGNADAKVEVVEFFDPACGACAYYHPIVKKILKDNYPNIRMVFRYAPFHKNSNYAVKMLEAAKLQDKYIETLEFMYQTQNQWVQNHTVNPQILYSLLSTTNLDMSKFSKDFNNSGAADKLIIQDLKDVEKLKITKTPTYFVNGKPLLDFSAQNLKKLIESQL